MTKEKEPSGVGVDSSGGPVIDPTANVIALVQANKESADAVNAMRDRYMDAEIRVVRETVQWLGKVSEIHQQHDREIHKMEQEKLAAFRASDEMARLTEANRQLAAIEVLARTTQTNADNLRNALDTTASTIAKQNTETNSEIHKRLAALEKSGYEGTGKGIGARNLWFIIAAVIMVMGFILVFGTTLVGVALYVSRQN
jgi:hypothetical protein